MPHILQRYPRYIVLVAVLIVGSFLYLQAPYSSPILPASYTGLPGDPSLPARIKRAEHAYQKVLEKRPEFIKQHGPSPSQVVMCVDHRFVAGTCSCLYL